MWVWSCQYVWRVVRCHQPTSCKKRPHCLSGKQPLKKKKFSIFWIFHALNNNKIIKVHAQSFLNNLWKKKGIKIDKFAVRFSFTRIKTELCYLLLEHRNQNIILTEWHYCIIALVCTIPHSWGYLRPGHTLSNNIYINFQILNTG